MSWFSWWVLAILMSAAGVTVIEHTEHWLLSLLGTSLVASGIVFARWSGEDSR